jgi:hypothetical protein
MGCLVIADFFGDGGARYAFALSPKLRPLVVPYLPNQYKFHDRRRVSTPVATPYRTGQGLAKGLGCSFYLYKAAAYDKSAALEDWVWLRRVDRRSWGQETRRTWLDQGMKSFVPQRRRRKPGGSQPLSSHISPVDVSHFSQGA